MDMTTRSRIALALVVAIGFCIGVIVGYSLSSDDFSFGYWLRQPVRFGALWWGLFGSAVGIGLLSIRRLTAR